MLANQATTRSRLANETGMTLEGVRKSVEYLTHTGDIRHAGELTIKGRPVTLYELTTQGRHLVHYVLPNQIP